MSKLTRLQGKARKHYNAYHDVLDEYSCGAELAEHMSPRLREHKKQYNNLITEVKKLDPACPEDCYL